MANYSTMGRSVRPRATSSSSKSSSKRSAPRSSSRKSSSSSPRSSSSSSSSSASWDRATASNQELSDYAEGKADARGGYPPQPPSGRSSAAYMAGYRGTRSSSSSSSSPRSSSRKSSSSRSSSRKSSSSRRRPLAGAGRQASSRLQRPVQSNVVSLAVLFAAAAAIAVLYNLLQHADTTATAIDKLTSAVRWLDSTQPIPYHN